MCVASYGVMPQAYSVATGPAAASTSSPEAVSCSRGAGPLPGSTGTSARRHDSMFVRLSCVSGQAIPASRQVMGYRTGQSGVWGGHRAAGPGRRGRGRTAPAGGRRGSGGRGVWGGGGRRGGGGGGGGGEGGGGGGGGGGRKGGGGGRGWGGKGGGGGLGGGGGRGGGVTVLGGLLEGVGQGDQPRLGP